MQDNKRDADAEKGFVDTAGEGEGEGIREGSSDEYTRPRVKQTAGGKLPCDTGAQPGAL